MPSDDPVFYAYDRCETCRKARRWLDAHKVAVRVVPLVEAPPSAVELRKLIQRSGLHARKWLNTSGMSYRALVAAEGKDAVNAYTDNDIVERLAADGKLIKRPVLVTPKSVVVGFREAAYEAVLSSL